MTWETADQKPNRHNILLSCLQNLSVVDNSTWIHTSINRSGLSDCSHGVQAMDSDKDV